MKKKYLYFYFGIGPLPDTVLGKLMDSSRGVGDVDVLLKNWGTQLANKISVPMDFRWNRKNEQRYIWVSGSKF